MRVPTQDRAIAIDVLWAHLDAIAAEMSAAFLRTAFSPEIRDAGDCSCALFDRRGRLITQASTSPGQLGSMPFLMAEFLRRVPLRSISPGDVFITNDPWVGCGHTPDIYVAAPIFDGDDMLGFACISGHHADVGGRLGSHESREVYEEGVQIPISRLVKAGSENAELLELLRLNSRRPNELVGDLRAQVSGTAVATTRLLRLSRRTSLGGDGVEAVTDEIISRSEAAVRAAIRGIPSGTYHSRLELDDLDSKGRPLVVELKLTVEGEALIADFAGTSPQVAYPINSVLNFTRAYVFTGVKMAVAPRIPSNAGAIAPITVVAEPGTILNASYPAPVRWRTTVGQVIPDAIFLALANAIPERVLAGNGTVPRWHEIIYSRGPNRDFIVHCHFMGGMGAAKGRDGLSAIAWPSNICEIPVEYIERDSPLRVIRKAYRTDSGGAGEWRGGLGEEILVLNPLQWGDTPGQVAVASINSYRVREGAAGASGGGSGGRGEVLLDGEPMKATRGNVAISPGSTLTLRTPGGGGFGSPEDREVARVRDDLRRGLISRQAADHVYRLRDREAGHA